MATMFDELPRVGAWQLQEAYDGTEVVRFRKGDGRTTIEGTTVGTEAGIPWSIHYTIRADAAWRVREATIIDYEGNKLEIQVDQTGLWIINGKNHPELQGRLDLDLEASAVTNTIPVHRLALKEGERGESAAVYIRTVGLTVEQLDQTYLRLPDQKGELLFDYQAPRFGYHDTLRFGKDGLAIAYPGIGRRVQ
jgi:hypothetical protein